MTLNRTLLVAAVACGCAPPALAQNEVLTPIRIDRSRLRDAFETRVPEYFDVYDNTDLGASAVWFYYENTHTAGEELATEKRGYSFGLDLAIGPVAAPSKVARFVFYIYAYDPDLDEGEPVDCAVTFALFDHTVDFMPVGSVCTSSGNDSVCRGLLDSFFVDLSGDFAPLNGSLQGYELNISAFDWKITDGNVFLDMRVCEPNGESWPVALSETVYPVFNGPGDECAYAAGAYPLTGTSADGFYTDVNGDGRYQRDERRSAGEELSPPAVSNLMVRFLVIDGCTFDLDGNGYVNADDFDYALEMTYWGC